jgi:Protein of unknown function (DUF2283)
VLKSRHERAGVGSPANREAPWSPYPEGVKSAVTEVVSPGIMLDFDSEGRVIGIEVLDVSERMMRPKAAA